MRCTFPGLARVCITLLIAVALFFSGYRAWELLAHASRLPFSAELLLSIVPVGVVCSGTPAAAVLALALLWRTSQREDSRALALFLALLAYAMAGDGSWLFGSRHHWSPLLMQAMDTGVPLAGIFAIAAFVRFSTLFPQPLAPPSGGAEGGLSRTRWWLLRPRSLWGSATAVAVVLVLVPQTAQAWADLAGRSFHTIQVVKPVVIGILLAAMALGVVNLRAGYRDADEEGRRRVFWIVEGFLAGTTLLLAASVLKALQMATGYTVGMAWWFALAVYASLLVVLACLAVAMFYAGALDPSLAIRRTAVIGMVGISMIFVFAGVEQVVQQLLGDWLGMSDRFGGMLTGGIVALTFDPVKTRAGALVERWLGRNGEAPAEVGLPLKGAVVPG